MTKVNRKLLLARFKCNPPASWEAIEQVQEKLSFRLPRSYTDFLLTSDGGEGFVGNAYLMLWKVEELITRNATDVAEFAPMLFFVWIGW